MYNICSCTCMKDIPMLYIYCYTVKSKMIELNYIFFFWENTWLSNWCNDHNSRFRITTLSVKLIKCWEMRNSHKWEKKLFYCMQIVLYELPCWHNERSANRILILLLDGIWRQILIHNKRRAKYKARHKKFRLYVFILKLSMHNFIQWCV